MLFASLAAVALTATSSHRSSVLQAGVDEPQAGADASADVACPAVRERKSWRQLSDQEKTRYYSAIYKLQDAELLEPFIQIHELSYNLQYAHSSSSGFFPWHRKYLLEFETAIRSLGDEFACFTLPYWNYNEDGDLCLDDPNCTQVFDNSMAFNDMGGYGDASCASAPYAMEGEPDYIPLNHMGDFWSINCTNQLDPEHCAGPEMQALYGPLGCGAVATSGNSVPADHTLTQPMPVGVPGDECHSVIGYYPAAQGCITSGPFAGLMHRDANPRAEPAMREGANPRLSCLTRVVNGTFERHEVGLEMHLKSSLHKLRAEWMVNSSIMEPDWGAGAGFNNDFQNPTHGLVHLFTSGDAGGPAAPLDPLFWLYHAYIDKVWATWQDCWGYDDISYADANRTLSTTSDFTPSDPNEYVSNQYQANRYENEVAATSDLCDKPWFNMLPNSSTCWGGKVNPEGASLCWMMDGARRVYDRLEDSMPFDYPDVENRCKSDNVLDFPDGLCYRCVVDNYAWENEARGVYGGHTQWGNIQYAGCAWPLCSEVCGAPTILNRTKARPADVIPTWDGTRNRVSDYHDIHQLGYAYSADVVDELTVAKGFCPTPLKTMSNMA